jgi:hypothetical protein
MRMNGDVYAKALDQNRQPPTLPAPEATSSPPTMPLRKRVEGTDTMRPIMFHKIPQDRLHDVAHSRVVCEVRLNGGKYSLSSLWMTSASNMLIKSMPNISSQHYAVTHYTITANWSGTKFSGMDLMWDYTERTC